jgi:organic hydroperoxide reductase OsmC/OhrA
MTQTEELQVELRQVSRSIPAPEEGPNAGESVLASVAVCFMNELLAVIRRQALSIDGVRTAVAGRLGGTPARFETLDLRVTAEIAESESLRQAVEAAGRDCIMLNTLRGVMPVRIEVG